MKVQVKEKELEFENSIIFDSNSTQWSNSQGYDLMFIKAQQTYFNDALRARGHVFLNEILDALGLPRTQTGAILGWINAFGSKLVDFKAEVLNDEQIKLTFDVDGIIWDKI